jgi:hypothetical protein
MYHFVHERAPEKIYKRSVCYLDRFLTSKDSKLLSVFEPRAARDKWFEVSNLNHCGRPYQKHQYEILVFTQNHVNKKINNL